MAFKQVTGTVEAPRMSRPAASHAGPDLALGRRHAIQWQQGFAVYILRNEQVEIAVVPELGAKIISLKNLRTDREWMWHPPEGLKLFRSRPGDCFSKSPLVGADECLPTIAPCSWQGRELPDHGEVWSMPWQVDSSAWENGILKTSIRLPLSPFEFTRTIALAGNAVQIDYQLENHAPAEEAFLWAMHPLLRLQPGDRLELPTSTRTLLNGASWVDAVTTTIPEKKFAKNFAAPVSEGLAVISNHGTGDRLEFEWSPLENNTLGLWLTRGGWHGHHHFAIEPTNGADDALTVAAGRKHCGMVPPKDFVTWQLRLRTAP